MTMVDNWDTFSSNLISDPFLDDPEKLRDDLEYTNSEFCESLDSLSSEALSSKGSVTSLDHTFSYSLGDNDLDDRATSSSTLNSIYDSLEDNEVFSPLFDEPSSDYSSWNQKHQDTSDVDLSKPYVQHAPSVATTVSPIVPSIIGICDYQTTPPVFISQPPKIVKMTVPAATPVHEVIRAAGIGVSRVQSRRFRVLQQPELSRSKIVVVRKPLTPVATYIPVTNAPTVNKPQSYSNIPPVSDDEDWDKDMPVLTREAPFKPEQLQSCPPSIPNRPLQFVECPKCQKKLPSKHSLAKHLHLHEPARFKCGYCDKLFYDRTKLRRHQIVHNGEKRFECGLCGTSFTMEQNLRVHMRSHQEPLRYRCVECNQGFSQLVHLKNHVHIHSLKTINT